MDFDEREEEKALAAAKQHLLEALGDLSESISFCASGIRPLTLPGLIVDGIGEVALPVSKTDAKRLIKKANQAPYGRGEATIVDTDVRRVWQLEPDQFRLENPKWEPFVHEIAKSVKAEFGIKQKVTASLYKLLVYENGSFFVPHRDTEKSHRMFATLVICLPSKHKGGQLIVSHSGQSQLVDFSDENSVYDLQYAAFYADCEHEVRPVTDGFRICLIYNLAISGRNNQPAAPDFSDSIESTASAIETIFDKDDERDMIILPLMHQYTEAGLTPDGPDNDAPDEAEDGGDDNWADDEVELGRLYEAEDEDEKEPHDETWDHEASDFQGTPHETSKSAKTSSNVTPVPLEFKGADRARADVLSQAATRADCRAFVALLTHWQTGCPDYSTIDYAPTGRFWGDGYADVSDENEGAEFEEVVDESMSLKHWHTLDGTRQPFHELSINERDIISDVVEEDRLYRQEVHEATGNAGMSMERWYHQAVIVLWPQARHYHVLASQGSRNSVPALHDLVTATDDPNQCDDCQSFAQRIIDHWSYRAGGRRGDTDSLGTSMMHSLLAIGDSKLAQKFFEKVLPLEYATLDSQLLPALANLAKWKSIEEPLLSFFSDQKADDYHADLCGLVTTFGALASGGDRVSPVRKQVCKAALKEVFAMIQRWEKRCNSSQSNPFVGTIQPLVRGVCSVGTRNDLKALLARIAAKQEHYDLHQVLIPAVNNLSSDGHFASDSRLAETALRELRHFCIDELTGRTAKEPAPPKNWKRKAKLNCDCPDCKELTAFLEDKDAKVYRFPRRKDLRQHLHRQIDDHRIDCAHVTERHGRPYTLVCTKNQASFEREMKQYKIDCRLLKELIDG